MTTLADRIVRYSLVAATAMIVGATVSWAITALFVILLVILVWFSVEISRLEAERDKLAKHAILGLPEWQVAHLRSYLERSPSSPRRPTSPTDPYRMTRKETPR